MCTALSFSRDQQPARSQPLPGASLSLGSVRLERKISRLDAGKSLPG